MKLDMEWVQRNRWKIIMFGYGAVALTSVGMAGFGLAARELGRAGPSLLNRDGHHIESPVRSIESLGFGAGKDYVLTFEKGYPGEVIFPGEVLNDAGVSPKLDLGKRVHKGDFVIVDTYAGLPPHRPAGVHLSRVVNGVSESVLELDKGRRRYRDLIARAGAIGSRYIFASVTMLPVALIFHLGAFLYFRVRARDAASR